MKRIAVMARACEASYRAIHSATTLDSPIILLRKIRGMMLLGLLYLFSAPAAFAAKECIVGGCSSQLCIEKGSNEGISTCEWTDAYGCYKLFGECTTLPDGSCGWKDKGSLAQCLKNPEEFKPQMNAGAPAIPEEIKPPSEGISLPNSAAGEGTSVKGNRGSAPAAAPPRNQP